LSETATYAAELSTRPTMAEQATASEASSSFPRLDGELMPLVMSNANTVVMCPWMSGEVTLSDAMINYYRPMTEDIAGEIIAELYNLLANQVSKKVEPEGEDEKLLGNEATKKAKPKEVEQDLATVPKDRPKPAQKLEVKAEEPVLKIKNNVTATKAAPSSRMPARHSEVSTETTNIGGSNTPEVVVVAQPEVAPVAASSQIMIETNVEVLSNSEPAELEIITAVEADFIRPEELFEAEDQAEILEVADQALPLPEAIEENLDQVDLIPGDPVDDFIGVDMSNENLSILTNQAEALIINHQIETTPHADTQLVDMPIALELEEATVIQLQAEESLVRHIDSTSEQLVEVDLNVQEIGDALLEIAEQIEISEPKKAEAALEILDKITEAITRFEQQGKDEVMTELELQGELEELFTELFEQLGIDYTPELIKSLARLAIQKHSVEHVKVFNEEGDATQDIGTHEVITKLLIGASNIKKAMENVCVIGKSAIHLYAYDFRVELRRRLAA
jgi:hypothetical protein